MTKDMCQNCGKVYNAGPHSFLCPSCRKKHKSESAKRRNLSKLGREAKCKAKRKKEEQ